MDKESLIEKLEWIEIGTDDEGEPIFLSDVNIQAIMQLLDTYSTQARIDELNYIRTGAIVRDGQFDVKASMALRAKIDRRIASLSTPKDKTQGGNE